MPALAFFLGSWTINGATGHATIRRAFPTGETLTIEKTGTGTECRVLWKDLDGTSHTLRDIFHDGSRLVGNPAQDESSGFPWAVTISEDGSGKGLTGTVRQLRTIQGEGGDDGESNLAGVWGADAPPPIRGGGQDDPAG